MDGRGVGGLGYGIAMCTVCEAKWEPTCREHRVIMQWEVTRQSEAAKQHARALRARRLGLVFHRDYRPTP